MPTIPRTIVFINISNIPTIYGGIFSQHDQGHIILDPRAISLIEYLVLVPSIGEREAADKLPWDRGWGHIYQLESGEIYYPGWNRDFSDRSL